jgi:hypothetical protein
MCVAAIYRISTQTIQIRGTRHRSEMSLSSLHPERVSGRGVLTIFPCFRDNAGRIAASTAAKCRQILISGGRSFPLLQNAKHLHGKTFLGNASSRAFSGPRMLVFVEFSCSFSDPESGVPVKNAVLCISCTISSS